MSGKKAVAGTCRTCGRELAQVSFDGQILSTYHPAVVVDRYGVCPAMITHEYTPGGSTWTSFEVPADVFDGEDPA